MRRRFGFHALALGLTLVGAGVGQAQQAQPALYQPGQLRGADYRETAVPIGAVVRSDPVEGTIQQVEHSTTCTFDPIESYHTPMVANEPPLRETVYGKECNAGCNDSSGCGKAGKHSWLKRHKLRVGKEGWCGQFADPNEGQIVPGSLGYDAERTAAACNFECASCYARWDFEKRFMIAYSAAGGVNTGTDAGYGTYHSAVTGVEVLPWVIMDGRSCYIRWGLSSMFAYTHYTGNDSYTLRSDQSGRFLTVKDGESFSFLLGPTWRSDFSLFGLRFSPNATVGMVFDWATMHETLPVGADVVNVERFKSTGFDVGGFARVMLDVPLTSFFNIGVGTEMRFINSDVMMKKDDIRQHMGVFLQMSHRF